MLIEYSGGFLFELREGRRGGREVQRKGEGRNGNGVRMGVGVGIEGSGEWEMESEGGAEGEVKDERRRGRGEGDRGWREWDEKRRGIDTGASYGFLMFNLRRPHWAALLPWFM